MPGRTADMHTRQGPRYVCGVTRGPFALQRRPGSSCCPSGQRCRCRLAPAVHGTQAGGQGGERARLYEELFRTLLATMANCGSKLKVQLRLTGAEWCCTGWTGGVAGGRAGEGCSCA